MINAEIECKKSVSPVSRKCYLNREWTHACKVDVFLYERGGLYAFIISSKEECECACKSFLDGTC